MGIYSLSEKFLCSSLTPDIADRTVRVKNGEQVIIGN